MYPLLRQLEADHLIASVENPEMQLHDKRPVHAYHITERGKARFRDLMLDTTSNPGDYQKVFLYKVAGLEFLQSFERIQLIEHYINFCQTHLLYLTSKGKEMEQRYPQGKLPLEPERIHSSLNVLSHVAEQWQKELDWAKQLRENEMEQEPFK